MDNERPTDAAPEGQEHLGPTPDAKIEGIPDQIDIEIAAEPVEGEPEPEQKPQPKRPRSDPQRRIDQLTARQREAETNAERLLRENQELLARLESGAKETAAEREGRERAERAALIHHKTTQTLRQEAAQRDLQAAIEAGDAAKQADATGRLSAAAAELSKIADWEATHPAPTAKAPEPQRQEAKPEQRPEPRQEQRPLAPAAKAFIDENADWFNSNGEMRDELVSYAHRYEQRLVAQGRQAEINTEPYFDKLRAHMRTEFPDHPWDDDDVTVIPALEATNQPPTRNGRMPQMTRNNAVLPANGQAAPGAKPANGRVQVAMSDDEKELAIGQWENGGMGNHFRTGKPVASKQEAVEQWAYRKAVAAKNGRAA